jgi:hypothetical protein
MTSRQPVEIHIAKGTQDNLYDVTLNLPGRQRLPSRVMQLDRAELEKTGSDVDAYGRLLGQALFAGEALGHDYGQAIAVLQAQEIDFLVRLQLADQKLQEIHWERLQHPRDGKWRPIATTGRTPFSRYIPALDWGPHQPISERPLKVLVIISSPGDLAAYNLSAIEAEERQAIRKIFDSLTGLEPVYLESESASPPTLDNIEEELLRGYHLIHFVSHGAVARKKNQGLLYLETNEGKVDPVPADRLARSFSILSKPPKFCFLAACESAAQSSTEGFISLGPHLVLEGGLPAVVAMSEKVSLGTATTFIRLFYRQLLHHGEVDQAVNEARGLVSDRWDWSVPVLFSRLPDNQLLSTSKEPTHQHELDNDATSSDTHFMPDPSPVDASPAATPGYSMDSGQLSANHLTALKEALERRNLALFIGSDLPQAVTGLPSRADLSQTLAQRNNQQQPLPWMEIAERVSPGNYRHEVINFLQDTLPYRLQAIPAFYHNIATLVHQFRLETIITTAYDGVLTQALEQVEPRLSMVVRSGDERFTNPDAPTLIKLYGDLQQKDTLIITASDHAGLFRDRQKEPLLDEVRYAFRRNTVLFLGYNLSDPDFRSLLNEITEDSRNRRPIFALWSGLPEREVRLWEGRGITILNADPIPTLLGRSTSDNSAVDVDDLHKELEALPEETLNRFCFDHFQPVYQKFRLGTDQSRKTRLLLDYCRENNRLDELARLLRNLPGS